jgi:thioredoxin-like negative regulator of GroEL
MMRPMSSRDHDVVLATGLNVLVFRVAESRACQQFQPELDEFVRSRPAAAVWTVEAMEQRDLADRHGLRALPSIVVYRDGLPARRFAGGMSAADLGREVDEVAAADMSEEYNDWMLWMLETGEAGSPFIGSRSGGDGGDGGPVDPPSVLGRPQTRRPTTPLDPVQQFRPAATRGQSLGQLRPAVRGAAVSAARPLTSFKTAAGRMVPTRPTVPMVPAGENDLAAGHTAWYAGDSEAAIRHYTTVLERDPDAAEALNGRGQVLADSGDAARALVDLDRYLGIVDDPVASAYARSARALALAGVGRRDDAEREIGVALGRTPESAWAHLRRGRIHLLHGDREAAILSLGRSLETNRPPLTSAQRSLAEDLLGRI